MSVYVMNLVFRRGPSVPLERLVLLSLADNADDQGYCFPGVAIIAEKTAINERTILRHLSSLATEGWLTVEKRAVHRRKTVTRSRVNAYQLNMARLENTEVVPMSPSDRLSLGQDEQTMPELISGHDSVSHPETIGTTSHDVTTELEKDRDDVTNTARRCDNDGETILINHQEPSLNYEPSRNHPNPSACGRALGAERPEPSGSEPASPAASAPLAETPSRNVAEPSFGEVLDRLANLRPRLGDVEDLRAQIESHMATAGFAVARNVRTADRGDGAAGYVELVCTRRLGEPEMETVAFELGAAVARERDLMKLRKLGGAGVHRVIVLRTATRPVAYDGIHTVLALGWPGNGQAERLEAAKATQDAAMARMRVGQSGGLSQPQPAGAGERVEPNGITVNALLRDVRAELEGFGAEALAEWDEAFAPASYERHEAVEGAAGGTLLVLASPHPAETVRGLGQYSARIERAMAERFGPRVQVQVVAWDGSMSAGEEGL